MMGVGKKKFDEQKYSSLSFNDMVIKIKENPVFFEGNSDVFINEIKEIKNKGDSGWGEIRDALNIELEGEARRKIDKYLNKAGMKYDDFIKNKSINKEVVADFNDEKFANQPTHVEEKERNADNNGCDRCSLSEGIKKEVKHTAMTIKNNIKDCVRLKLKKENRCEEVNKEVKKIEYNSFNDLIKELEGGSNLSESGLSYIKFLTSYIRTREMLGGEDNIRKEIDNVFIKISSSLCSMEDKKKVLLMYQDARFLSIYDACCRTVVSLVTNKLGNFNFSRDTIDVIKNNLVKYCSEHIDVLKHNQSDYTQKIKNIKNVKDEESRNEMYNIESIRRLKLINTLISNDEFTGEKSKYLPDLVSNSKNNDIVKFFDEKMNLNIELLQSECDNKIKEEKFKRDAYITNQKQYMDGTILNIKEILTKRSVSSETMELINKSLGDRICQENIDTFPSKLDLILNLLQRKKINPKKIYDDIREYLDLSPDQLVKKIDDTMEPSRSFRERFFFRFKPIKERLINFISNAMRLFK
ncbi:hypothetical protein KYI78_08070 [Providencia rettgeri]|uniref:hypothetical protein n=2 Tax=Providencia rettgeri TaxID=587 RepID=UPI0013744D31|nr:hypothetical protein [Providencia rettgeri]MBW3105181.1 hypothetical protein [Providencia rettgeri]BBU97599.1 hypothetical protein BML2496_34820 [Providencia rettgeri]